MGSVGRNTMRSLTIVFLLLGLAHIESTQANKPVFQIDLMAYHHENSPVANPDLSLAQLITIAIASSQERLNYFNDQICKHVVSGKKVFQSPVYSNQGNYLMQIEVGSPPKTFVAILDTGSDLFWLQCDCLKCYPQPDPFFDPTQSSTYKPENCYSKLCEALPGSACANYENECSYIYGYGDESTTSGILASEVITLNSVSSGSSSFTVDFGCGRQNQGTFSATDGLVGLGRGPLSIVSQIGYNFGNVFSYCLVSFYSSKLQTSPLYLGDTGGTFSYTDLIYNINNPTFYYVQLNGILVDGNAISIPEGTFDIDATGGGGFILDSGTTLTQLQSAAYTPLLTEITSLINYTQIDGAVIGLDACYTPETDSPTWPEVTFQFDRADVVLPGDNLFLLVDNQGAYCLAIQGTDFGFGIFGNVQQQNFLIQYNVWNNMVGFRPQTC